MKSVLSFLVLFGVFMNSVHPCPTANFGPNCRFSCHCLDAVACDIITGECPNGCAPGWDGNSCQRENVAYRRRVTQKNGKHSEDGALAVDDVMTTCSFTKPVVPGWWMVQLDTPTRVETIRIVAGPTTSIKNWDIYAGMESTIFSMSRCTSVRIHGDGATLACDVAVLGQYVMVVNKAGPVELCDFRIYVCAEFWFGTMCDNMCRCKDKTEVCDVETGVCASGCSEGWSGDDCQTGCENTYGSECKTPCGYCEGGTCHHMTGECSNGCREGWNGTMCTQECDDQHYGNNCAFRCGHCHGNTSCDRRTGKCVQGCETGYTGETCHKDCSKGFYGKNCSLRCDYCNHGDCDVISGTCRSGCVPGRKGGDCPDACPTGWFGRKCSRACANCEVVGESACDVGTGRCLHGCKPGYNGTRCKTPCPRGHYGRGCQSRCGACTPGDTCDVQTGTCPGGCGHGHHGDFCNMTVAPVAPVAPPVFADEDGPQLKLFLGTSITLVGGIMIAVVMCLVMAWNREHLAGDVAREKEEQQRVEGGAKRREEETPFMEQNGRLVADEEIVEYV